VPAFDVAIIGGGPAGSSTAITLARAGARVLLLERGRFPRHKVCGEFVSAESLALLASLVPETSSMAKLSIDHTCLFVDSRVVSATITPPAASIKRYDLDLALWNTARASGAECREQSDVTSVSRDEELFTLRDASGESFTARCIVDATGRWSRLRNDTAPPGPKWIGVKGHFAETREPNGGAGSVDLYFFELGYCGVQPVAPGVVNACAMVRYDRAKTLDEALTIHPALAQRARDWKPVFEPVTTAPLVFRVPTPVRPWASGEPIPIFCVGDAAAFVDPFVGDGISLALRTGVAAAQALTSFTKGAANLNEAAAAYASQYEREFAPVLKSAARVRRLLDVPQPLRSLAFHAMRVPFVADYVIRRTRIAG